MGWGAEMVNDFARLMEEESSFKQKYFSYLNDEFEPQMEDLLSSGNWHKVGQNRKLTWFLVGLMIRFYEMENEQKERLNREQLTTGLAGNYFENMVALLLRAFLKTRFAKLRVAINKRVRKGFKPDISIWMDEKPVAVLELKLHFNWRRDNDINSEHFRFKDFLEKKKNKIYMKKLEVTIALL